CFSVGKSYLNINENFGVYSIEASFSNTSVQLEREFTITKYRAIDMFCSDTNSTINNTIHCAIIAATQSRNDTIFVDRTQYSFSGDAISYFGAKVPQNITNPVGFSKNGYYLLPLTEAKFDANLIGFEGYALGIGTYNIFLANINSTYQTELCIDSTPESDLSSELFSNLQIANFQSVYGYNIYYLKTPIKILKGQMLAIKFNFPVAIDTSNDYLMSDYRMTCGQFLKLNVKYNWRIYFNWVIEQKYYLNYFYFAKTYNLGRNSIFGVYNVTASFLNANTSVTKTVNISNNMLSDFSCSTPTPKNTINCAAEMVSQSKIVEVDFGDCSKGNITNVPEFFDGFGVKIPENFTTPINPEDATELTFLLTNTEFLFDSKLIGFEFYASAIGSFTLILNKMSNCGTGTLIGRCGKYLENARSISSTPIAYWYLDSTTLGRNIVWLNMPYDVIKGSLFHIHFSGLGRISLDNSTDKYFQDYNINGTIITKIEEDKKFKFLFKALTTHGYFHSYDKSFNKTYAFNGYYDVFLLGTTKRVYVPKSISYQNLELICNTVKSFTLECGLYIISRVKSNSILIDYGDCQKPDLIKTTGSNYLEYFGPNLDSDFDSNITFNFQNESSFLLLNNEFKFESNLIGFEMYAINNGSIDISFVTFTECGSMMSCSTYLSQHTTFAKANLITSLSFNIEDGYNKFLLSSPVSIPKGAVLLLNYPDTGRIKIAEDLSNYFGDLVLNGSGRFFTSNLDSSNRKYKFLINSIIDVGYFYEMKKIVKNYPFYESYNVSLRMSNSSINIKGVFNIRKDKTTWQNLTYLEKKNYQMDFINTNGACRTQYTETIMDEISPICYLNLNCSMLLNISADFMSELYPKDINRNQEIKITAIINENCIHKYTITFQWKILKLTSNGNYSEIQSPLNLNLETLNLKIPKDTLFYGIYKLRLEANLTVDTGYIKNINNSILSQIDANVRILPSGIDIFSLENYLDSIKIGQNQSLEFQPALYSYDYDQIAKFDSVKFNFYCFLRNKSENLTFLEINKFPLTHDLYSYSSRLTLSNECFTETILNYYGTQFYQFVKVDVVPAPRAPRIRLECKIPTLCIPSFRSIRFNTENQLAIASNCFDGCQGSINTIYMFDIYMSNSGLGGPWQTVSQTTKTKYLYGLNSKEMIISKGFFDQYPNFFYWKIELMMLALYDIEGDYIDVNTTMLISTIQKPYNGSCSIHPTEGSALMTDFSIECSNWIDTGGYVADYSFYAAINTSTKQLQVPLWSHYNGTVKLKLPEGSKSNGYILRIFIQISNDLGAFTEYEIPKNIIVIQKSGFMTEFTNQILNPLNRASLINDLFKRNPVEASKNLLSLTFMMISPLDNNETNSNNKNLTNTIPLNARTEMKSIFIDIASSLPVEDLRSIKTVSLVISKLTEDTNEVTFRAASVALDKNQELTGSLFKYKDNTSFSQLKQASDNIVDSAASSLIVLASPQNNETSNSSIEILSSVSQIFNNLLNISSVHLGLNQESEVNTNSINLKFIKTDLNVVNKNISLENGDFKLPDSFSSSELNKQFLIQTFSMAKPVIGQNGMQVNISDSSFVSLSFFNTENNREIPINFGEDTKIFFTVRIKRNLRNIEIPEFQIFNTTKITVPLDKTIFFSFNVTNPNSSIHVQIKPENVSKAIIVLIKLNENPSFKLKVFDLFKIFCPNDLMIYNGTEFYQFFANMSTTKKFWKKSYMGVIFRQLTDSELKDYCKDKNKDKMVLPESLNEENPDFKYSDFTFRVFTSGCYFIDKNSGNWSSSGMEVIEDGTDLEYINCRTNHLTDFAGGF
ncbi:unnamed protein product, partial [Brachionus calyciflorus]